MKENKNISFLNCIYQIGEMGVVDINDCIDKVSKSHLRELLEKEKEEYNKILEKCEALFSSYGAQEKEIGAFTKLKSKVLSDVKLLQKKEDDAIVQMMILGTQKGIKKLEENINMYNEEDKEVLSLAFDLLKIMKHNLEDLKIYL